MRRILSYCRRYLKEVILSPLFKLLEAVFELIVPLVVASIIDKGIAENDTQYLTTRIILLVVFAVVGFGCAITAQYFAAYAAGGVTSAVRGDLFRHIEGLSVESFEKTGSSRIITGLTSDCNQISSGINLTLRLLLRSPFIVIGAAIMAFTVSPRMSLIFAGMLIVLSIIIALNLKLLLPLNVKTREAMEQLVSKSSNGIAGSKVIRGFNRQNDDCEEFMEKSSFLQTLQKKTGSVSALLNPLTFVIVNICICLLIYRGAVNVSYGNLTQGQVVALYNYMSQILVELIKLANLIINVSRAAVCARRVDMFFNIPLESRGTVTIDNPSMSHRVVFDHVNFRYPDSNNDSLSDISFEVGPGEMIGIIGKTGSGKSTLASLAAGVLKPSSGDVLIDGTAIQDLSEDSRARSVSFCIQKAGMFTGSLRYNVALDREYVTEDMVASACETSCSDEFIASKSEGLEYQVYALGTGLSGGQKQRINIARGLAGHPGVIILDDSTSALDAGTEKRFLSNLASLENKPTVIMISQKINSVKNLNRIMLLEDGRITHFAPHDELYMKSETYRHLCELQGVGAE
ncbi:ABC-type multidrug transport system, ATPase and permease component [Ruminococcaceae bacterium YRB3002]|nr:ABC-type multidrug transport system, ATPase and permease component [Ruminococcaceae bacterium YRB3002]